MSKSDRVLDPEEIDDVMGYVEQGLRLLGREGSEEAPEVIVSDIRVMIDKLKGQLAVDQDVTEVALALGCVWGQMVVEQLGWEWASLSLDGGEHYGVVSPDRAFAVLSMVLMRDYLSQPDRENTSLLVFNLLKAGKTPSSQPGSYRILC